MPRQQNFGSLCLFSQVGLSLAAALLSVAAAVSAAETKGDAMSYREACEFLGKHTKVIELTADNGAARVAICPQWQGRIMTSTCSGLEGPSFGFINRKFIELGQDNPHFNNYGGEERLWLAPEGGQYSLFFKPGVKQVIENWFTPPAFNAGPWAAVADSASIRMNVSMKFQNTSATAFQLDVTRTVRLLAASDLAERLGADGAKLVAASGAKVVAYETRNQITNRGAAMNFEQGVPTMWLLAMLNAGPQTVVMVPYRSGSLAEAGPIIKSDYFGAVPEERLITTPEAVLFRADGKYRSKIGASQRRACNKMGSIDYQGGVLTLLQFNMPADPAKQRYVNNMWELPQANPFVGDVANSYNDGPNDLGEQFGAFYEIESLSPAVALKSGESLLHQQSIIHIQADPQTLATLARQTLGVDLARVRKEMLEK